MGQGTTACCLSTWIHSSILQLSFPHLFPLSHQFLIEPERQPASRSESPGEFFVPTQKGGRISLPPVRRVSESLDLLPPTLQGPGRRGAPSLAGYSEVAAVRIRLLLPAAFIADIPSVIPGGKDSKSLMVVLGSSPVVHLTQDPCLRMSNKRLYSKQYATDLSSFNRYPSFCKPLLGFSPSPPISII